jgi:hypothetical protein
VEVCGAPSTTANERAARPAPPPCYVALLPEEACVLVLVYDLRKFFK